MDKTKYYSDITYENGVVRMADNVNHPAHYEGNIECIDAMLEVLGVTGTIHFCIGNAFKYIWRCRKKHDTPVEDLKKARWYISKALELYVGKEEK